MGDQQEGIRWNRILIGAALVAGAVLIGLGVQWGATSAATWRPAMDLPDFGPLLGCLVLYMLPTLIAYGRRNRQALAIGALNLLLGWTILGWIAALIWALIVDRRDGART